MANHAMATGDIPSISNYASQSTAYGLGNLGQALSTTTATPFLGVQTVMGK